MDPKDVPGYGNGGPAFPVPLNAGQSWQGMAPCDGMTLRDYFAAQSLAALIGHTDKDYPTRGAKGVPTLARYAYEYADAMLAERAKEQQ